MVAAVEGLHRGKTAKPLMLPACSADAAGGRHFRSASMSALPVDDRSVERHFTIGSIKSAHRTAIRSEFGTGHNHPIHARECDGSAA